MHILILHNYYQQRGGEDECVEQEVGLLRDRGHEVELHSVHNDEIAGYPLHRKAALFFTPTWSFRARKSILRVIQEFRPDIVHVHNSFPLLSPAVHAACSVAGIPVVQTLHNYRLLAPCALLSRNGTVCERCIDGTLWNSVLLRCYRNSVVQSASVALMIKTHRMLRTWERNVDAFIVLTPFARDKTAEAGMDVSRFVVRPNFLSVDPGTGTGERSGAVYVGRLSEEKGVRVLLEAWRRLPDVPLAIVGDGPMMEWVTGYVRQHRLDSVRLHGWMKAADALEVVKRARFLVLPSVCYETFGRSIIEAYATATPVLVSNLGAIASLVHPGHTGLTFEPGNAADLAEKARYLLDHPDETAAMGANGRAEYIRRYTPEPAYRSLMEVYSKLVADLR